MSAAGSAKSEENLVELFVRPLHAQGLRYLIAGSVAAMYFSEPRLTIDIDIPLLVRFEDLAKIESCFSSEDFYCPPIEVLKTESRRECRGHFNVIHIPTGLKADFYPGNQDPTLAWAWQNKVEVESDSGPIYLAPVEYVILWKLIFYAEGKSQKHLRDIARILEVQTHLPHEDYLLAEIRTHRLEAVWEEISGVR